MDFKEGNMNSLASMPQIPLPKVFSFTFLREEPLGLIELAQRMRTSKEGADHI